MTNILISTENWSFLEPNQVVWMPSNNKEVLFHNIYVFKTAKMTAM